MFKSFFKKKEKNLDNKNILIGALLVHAAKIDENYTETEKEIIKKALMNLNEIKPDEANDLLKLAEEKEESSLKPEETYLDKAGKLIDKATEKINNWWDD